MNWKRIDAKTISQICLPDLEIGFDATNDNLKCLWIHKAGKTLLRIQTPSPEYNSLMVEVPAPPPKLTKFHVVGSVCDVPIRQVFDDKYEAERKRVELADATGSVFTVEPIEIEVI